MGPRSGHTQVLFGVPKGTGDAAKTYAARHGYDIDPNRGLIGLGAANLGSGLGSGMVVNGSLSVAHLARESTGAWLDVSRHPDPTPGPTVPVLRVESGLYFANSDHVHAAIRASVGPTTKAVIVDAQTAPFVNVTATSMLTQAARELERQRSDSPPN